MFIRITSRFYWLCDLIALGLAFELAYIVVPLLQPLLDPGRLLPQRWLEELLIWNGPLPPFMSLLWILIVTAPITLIVLGSVGNHGPLFNQSYTRIVAGSLLAPLIGLSVVVLALFAVKEYSVSRFFLFSFTVLSGLGLSLYRVALRIYLLRRRAAGYYAKNVVLIGLPPAIEWMARYFIENVAASDYRLLGTSVWIPISRRRRFRGFSSLPLGTPRIWAIS